MRKSGEVHHSIVKLYHVLVRIALSGCRLRGMLVTVPIAGVRVPGGGKSSGRCGWASP